MQRLLSTLLSMALLAITTNGLAWTFRVQGACAKPADSCCEHSHKDSPDAPAPANPTCLQCCLVCCAVILPTVDGLEAPNERILDWQRINFGWKARHDEPPVPPPRVS